MNDAGGEAGVVLFLGVEDVFFPTKRNVRPEFVGKNWGFVVEAGIFFRQDVGFGGVLSGKKGGSSWF